ncbi:MAG: hypothetical protein CL610_25500 [Anaerolineaceae bacterium]|nr:hypothetical protein [Anaerolineaceae bacterium]
MVTKVAIRIMALIIIGVLGLSPVMGEGTSQATPEDDSAVIVLEGPIQAINVNVITIANIQITLDNADPLLATLQPGDVVKVSAQINDAVDGGGLVADSVEWTGANILSPIITLRGSVQAVNVNIVTIFNLNIQFTPNDPVLADVNVGDILEVSGNLVAVGDTSAIIPVQVIIVVNVPAPGTPDDGSGVLINGFRVSFAGRVFNGTQTTFSYVVTGTGTPPDLSHFDVEIVTCSPELEVVGFSPSTAVSFGTDPTTGVDGIKWDIPLVTTESRLYAISFAGEVPLGQVTVAVKGGNGFESALLPGAGCSSSLVEIEKLISTDNATWQNADAIPGPELEPGTPVMFRFVVTNIGETTLTNLTLTDNMYDLSTCVVPDSLVAGAFFECMIGPFAADTGQHTNMATVQAVADGVEIQDSDSANYFGGDRPSIDLEKYVSVDQAGWQDADHAPGLDVDPDDESYFRFVVTNNGNVPLTAIALSDNILDTSSCAIPASLEPGAGFECVIGPFATTRTHANTATVTAIYQDLMVTDSDSAHYFTDDEQTDGPITIIIEGPVQAININIITIFNIDIELDPNDPILLEIEIGDIVRVEGTSTTSGNTIVIVAINIIIINIDIDDDGGVIIDDDDDDGSVVVPPPPPPSSGFSKDACKGGGWRNLRRADGSGFKNQGDCIQYANTGK